MCPLPKEKWLCPFLSEVQGLRLYGVMCSLPLGAGLCDPTADSFKLGVELLFLFTRHVPDPPVAPTAGPLSVGVLSPEVWSLLDVVCLLLDATTAIRYKSSQTGSLRNYL